jgi:antitoxin CptB
MEPPINACVLAQLKWRCRRGMLENDLLIERFFERHAAGLTARHAAALTQLMDLPDNDLLDLLLVRKGPGDKLNSPDVHEVLRMFQTQRGARLNQPVTRHL